MAKPATMEMAPDSLDSSMIKTRSAAKAPAKQDLMRTKLCAKLLRGMCSRGIECPYAHSQSELRQGPDLSKTQLCSRFMQVGKCRNGERCTYAHGEAELRKPPNYKKKLCRWYQKGLCRQGDECGFVHELSEACFDDDDASTTAPSSLAESMTSRSTSTWDSPEMCGDFKKGICTRGDRCKFLHGDFNDDRRVMSSIGITSMDARQMCVDFQNGKCARGDSCKYSHAIVKDDRQAAPEENLFRMMAGRGSAPLNQQMMTMGKAIADLQARLLKVQSSQSGSAAQVAELQQAISQLTAKYRDMESALDQEPSSPQSNASSNAGGDLRPIKPQKTSMQRYGVRGALFTLVFAMMVMVEWWLQSD